MLVTNGGHIELDAEIETMIHVLGEEDARSLIRILTKAYNALDLREFLGEVDD